MRTTVDTRLGRVALHWSRRGITRVELPPAAAGPEDPAPAGIRAVAERIRRHLAGDPARLDAPLDLEGLTPFARRVLETLRRTRPGETLSYGDLARRAGRPGAARAVGTALRRNPVPLLVPCHRVLAAGGRIGGFSAPGGLETKRRLLEAEGWQAPERPPRRRGAE
jgi:methylated-DNA-[protein]-cysteine S-methyltransferase